MAGKGHHGGAWKVAYADFVTAMMALFLVLWLAAQDTKLKEAVERAFRNPFSSLTKQSVGVIPNENDQFAKDRRGNYDSASAVELLILRKLNEDLLKSLIEQNQDPDERTVELDLTPEGLRITIFDRSHRPVFETQSIRFTPYGDWVMSTLSWSIARYPNLSIDVEGHTERGHPPVTDAYGEWELSADRANAARRKMLEHGVLGTQIRQVVGYAATAPMPRTRPEDEVNRRVSVLLRVNGPIKG
jgi:chemotaxis protein MotB